MVLLPAIVLLWCGGLVAAPAVVARGADVPPGLATAAAMTYVAGKTVCHQRPERSFRVAGQPMPVCARCTGIYFALAPSMLVALWWRRPRRLQTVGLRPLLGAAVAPTLLSIVIEQLSGWSPAPIRAAAGVWLGFGVGVPIARLLQEWTNGVRQERSATLP